MFEIVTPIFRPVNEPGPKLGLISDISLNSKLFFSKSCLMELTISISPDALSKTSLSFSIDTFFSHLSTGIDCF